jgi:hypothetical protein
MQKGRQADRHASRQGRQAPKAGRLTRQAGMGDWSSGMIPALGAGGHEFDSRITPFCLQSLTSGKSISDRRLDVQRHVKRGRGKKKKQPDAGLEPATSRLRACHSTD